jgi:fructose-1,6-bisphosphatase/sedoheptulose 1,7-bisphosphatase-like protein
VRFRSGGARSSSLVMRFPSRTVRRVETEHTWLGEGRPAVASSLDEDEHERIYDAR